MTDLVLLPGWGWDTAPLEPLAGALEKQGVTTHLLALPEILDDSTESCLERWLDDLDHRVKAGAWLLGWSLGGQLASALAARRGAACPGLITLASNPCFVQRSDWPCAMPKETFEAFAQGLTNQPEATLRRFALLCAQGDSAPRALAKRLQEGKSPAQRNQEIGLRLLGTLDSRPALTRFNGPQLHLLAEQDALLPQTLVEALVRLCNRAQIEQRPGAHASLLFDESSAPRIARFIAEAQ